MREVVHLFKHVGHRPNLHFGPEDKVISVNITPDKCWIVVEVARIKPRRFGYDVTHRGIRTVLFTRTGPTAWERDEHTWMAPLPAPQRHAAYTGPTPTEHAQRREWEEMCHRPGTPDFPLDNSDRRRQGY